MNDSESAGTGDRRRRAGVRVAAVGVLATLGSACDREADPCPADMPDNWICPDALNISATAPNCDQGSEMPSVSLSDDGDLLEVGGVIFRTGEDDVCAWGTLDNAVLNVLVQPCEMHPNEDDLKGFCYHHFDVTLPTDLSEVSRVDVFTRYDFLGYVAPDVPPLIEHGTVSLHD
jgi:hypothetical protein